MLLMRSDLNYIGRALWAAGASMRIGRERERVEKW